MEVICVDTNILIEYFRRKDKKETRLFKLATRFKILIPAIVAYEYLRGNKAAEDVDVFLSKLITPEHTIPFDFGCAQHAAHIFQDLKSSGKSIEPEDLLIAATARSGNFPLATLNPKHFNHIDGLQLISTL